MILSKATDMPGLGLQGTQPRAPAPAPCVAGAPDARCARLTGRAAGP